MVILIENKIPFIKNRLEKFAEVRYLSAEEFTSENVRHADALIVRTRTRCDANLLSGSRVRFIATATIGTDHIDIEWCNANGIKVVNAPGCNAPAVAQYVWASIISIRPKVSDITLGVVGCGNVGRIVAEWGERLGAEVLRCDPLLAARREDEYNYMSLEEMLPKCNVVTLHTPLTFSGSHPTYHLIGKHELDLMPLKSVLINAARGGVVDTPALIEKAKSEDIIPIIDCWEGEPFIDEELLDLAYIATPHIAGYSLEGKQRATRMVVEATASFFDFPIDKENLNDLADTYIGKSSISLERIVESYCPMSDTECLRTNMKIVGNQELKNNLPDLRASRFEHLRSTYKFRNEA